jgi:hypothetical protein
VDARCRTRAVRHDSGGAPIKLFGEFGFYNLHSALMLVVPVAAMDVVTPQLAAEIATGDAAGPRVRVGNSGGHVAEYAVRLKPGMRKAVPLGSFGELGGRGRVNMSGGQPFRETTTRHRGQSGWNE